MSNSAATRVATSVAVCSALALVLLVSHDIILSHARQQPVSLLTSRGECWCWLFAPAVALPSFISFSVYLCNCNICLDICFVPLLFSSDTTLPLLQQDEQQLCGILRREVLRMQIWGETTILLVCAHLCVHLLCICMSTAFLQTLLCFFANELGWAGSYSLHASVGLRH